MPPTARKCARNSSLVAGLVVTLGIVAARPAQAEEQCLWLGWVAAAHGHPLGASRGIPAHMPPGHPARTPAPQSDPPADRAWDWIPSLNPLLDGRPGTRL